MVGAEYHRMFGIQAFDYRGTRMVELIQIARRDKAERRMQRVQEWLGGRCLAPVVSYFQ